MTKMVGIAKDANNKSFARTFIVSKIRYDRSNLEEYQHSGMKIYIDLLHL